MKAIINMSLATKTLKIDKRVFLAVNFDHPHNALKMQLIWNLAKPFFYQK
jgi:hypothetical protein